MQHNSHKSHTLFIHMWMLEIRLRLDFVCLILCLVLVLTDGKSYTLQMFAGTYRDSAGVFCNICRENPYRLQELQGKYVNNV